MSSATPAPVGLLATACAFPSTSRSITEVLSDEDVQLSPDAFGRLGISSVGVSRDGETGADLALTAAETALSAAGVKGKQIDLILDYTVLPQLFLVPVWNLGNKLQHELDATNAFTLGFSGGGTSNFHVALRFATDLLRANEHMRTALLFGADTAIPGNRVINQDEPVTVLGDGASAIVLSRDAESDIVLGTEISTDGAYHDVSYIPGGALNHLDREDRTELYRLQIDTERLTRAPLAQTLKRLGDAALDDAGRQRGDVRHFIFPNLSAADQAMSAAVWGVPPTPRDEANRSRNGHVQATDLVLNLESLTADDACARGDLIMVSSHGLGFTAGVTLLQH